MMMMMKIIMIKDVVYPEHGYHNNDQSQCHMTARKLRLTKQSEFFGFLSNY